MSDEMNSLAKSYAAVRDAAFPESEFFFPSPFGGPYSAGWMQGKFKRFFALSKPDVPKDLLPSVRVYDLRHRFATAVLNRWLDEKKSLRVFHGRHRQQLLESFDAGRDDAQQIFPVLWDILLLAVYLLYKENIRLKGALDYGDLFCIQKAISKGCSRYAAVSGSRYSGGVRPGI